MAAPAAKFTLNPAIRWAVGSWSFFILENTLISENRTLLISHLGDDTYHACYGLCSTIAMGSVGYAYKLVRGAGPLLWTTSQGAPLSGKIGSFVCLGLGLGMVSQMPPKLQIPVEYRGASSGEIQPTNPDSINSNMQKREPMGFKVRCPFDFTDNKNPDSNTVTGLERISRHPGLWSFGLIGLGQALLIPSVPQRAWLTMPLLVALIGGAHTDSRYKRGMGGTLHESYEKQTSNIPFAAMLGGKQGDLFSLFTDMKKEVKPVNAVLAVGIAGVWVLRKGRGVKVPLR